MGLLRYAQTRRHGTVVLEQHHVRTTFANWKDTLREDPECYQARITDQQLPIEYSIASGDVAMIGQGAEIETAGRLMGFVLVGESSTAHFRDDFAVAWERAERETPDNAAVSLWIDETLLPALEAG